MTIIKHRVKVEMKVNPWGNHYKLEKCWWCGRPTENVIFACPNHIWPLRDEEIGQRATFFIQGENLQKRLKEVWENKGYIEI